MRESEEQQALKNALLDQLAFRLERRFATALLSLPSPALVRIAGGKPRTFAGLTLDPQAQMTLWLAEKLGRDKKYDDVASARDHLDRQARLLAPKGKPLRRVENRVADGVPIRLYFPHGIDRPAAALVFYHGGGFVLGSLASHDGICRHLASETPIVVVSVGYRLAPEHKFPAAPNDAVTAFRWIVDRADLLGLDPKRIGVGGDSAGGNLAAVVAHEQKKARRAMPAFSLLIYPATDLTRSMPSHRLFHEGFFLDWATTTWFRDRYLGSAAEERDPRASPIFNADFAGLPPAFVVTAGFDPLRDEGEAYAEKLKAAGVCVVTRRDEGMCHGYCSAAGVMNAGKSMLREVTRFLREQSR